MKDKVQSFVYYGSEHYISLSSLRAMVPAVYLLLGFTGAVVGIVGNAPVLMAAFLSLIAAYAIVVYTFHLWCPTPSFACRFAVSAFSALSISIILQSWGFFISFGWKAHRCLGYCVYRRFANDIIGNLFSNNEKKNQQRKFYRQKIIQNKHQHRDDIRSIICRYAHRKNAARNEFLVGGNACYGRIDMYSGIMFCCRNYAYHEVLLLQKLWYHLRKR